MIGNVNVEAVGAWIVMILGFVICMLGIFGMIREGRDVVHRS